MVCVKYHYTSINNNYFVGENITDLEGHLKGLVEKIKEEGDKFQSTKSNINVGSLFLW